MKQILAVIITVLMMASLTACGDNTDGEVQKPSNVSTGNTEVPKNNNDSDSETEQPVETGVTIEETVLVNEGGVKITAKSLSMC